MTEQQRKKVKEEAPSWVLSFLITLLLTMQLTVRADDISAQKIDILGGETLYAWDESWQSIDTEQHIYSNSQQPEGQQPIGQKTWGNENE
ncbi:hypothetical protein LRP52_02095 [Photobacterium sp. ZSDE20]|uniref:Secreted protein n=1 Tax=Photobacterium pectinilyticum TaxID=2906793 RepID=A0ABT1MZE7_9GAMM|nr:hypothetical protein [Photobacterium sp. ZSDE20]MCQ1056861.1 hypothetical protein [Photobacterium sp. ZSDE20]MDD1820996.1 hypothetical protein [Photobacterium sp. ZSDE20]